MQKLVCVLKTFYEKCVIGGTIFQSLQWYFKFWSRNSCFLCLLNNLTMIMKYWNSWMIKFSCLCFHYFRFNTSYFYLNTGDFVFILLILNYSGRSCFNSEIPHFAVPVMWSSIYDMKEFQFLNVCSFIYICFHNFLFSMISLWQYAFSKLKWLFCVIKDFENSSLRLIIYFTKLA